MPNQGFSQDRRIGGRFPFLLMDMDHLSLLKLVWNLGFLLPNLRNPYREPRCRRKYFGVQPIFEDGFYLQISQGVRQNLEFVFLNLFEPIALRVQSKFAYLGICLRIHLTLKSDRHLHIVPTSILGENATRYSPI